MWDLRTYVVNKITSLLEYIPTVNDANKAYVVNKITSLLEYIPTVKDANKALLIKLPLY